jgi:aspartate/methionine/tyrosine aminotransferase
MTGWRLGWLIVPEAFIRPVEKLAQNLFIAPSTPAQHAALAAFLPETRAILEARRTEFRQRRDFLLGELLRLGFTIPAQPEGAFYIYVDISAFSGDSFAFASRLLDEAGIAATPGLDFGNADPARYMRFAYTTNLERLAEGVARLEKMLGR